MKKTTIELGQMSYAMTEELKTLRTNISFCGEDKQVIMVTSSLSGEGKTETSLKLAYSLTELKKKVLLIDTDLRKSVMISRAKATGVDNGLTHFLAGQCTLADVVMSTNIPRLHMVFAGPQAPNPTELLSTERFKGMIESARAVYDYIIIDAPPLGLVVDAAIISEQCDGSILVVESGEVKRKLVQSVKEKLEVASCPILGVVLNKVDRKKNGHYYGKYYGKAYGKQYGKYYGNSKENK